jgi:copper(I)-binding protein
MIRKLKLLAAACVPLALSCAWAQAQTVEVKDAWLRGTVPGQNATGAFMELTSKAEARLVAGASPAAGTVEIHNMKMEGGVMKMFAVETACRSV